MLSVHFVSGPYGRLVFLLPLAAGLRLPLCSCVGTGRGTVRSIWALWTLADPTGHISEALEGYALTTPALDVTHPSVPLGQRPEATAHDLSPSFVP